MAGPYAARVASLLHLIDVFDAEEAVFVARIAERLREHRGYRAIQALPGVGPTLGAIFVAEIGDVHRFAGPGPLCSWAGLTPRHPATSTMALGRSRVSSPSRRPIPAARISPCTLFVHLATGRPKTLR